MTKGWRITTLLTALALAITGCLPEAGDGSSQNGNAPVGNVCDTRIAKPPTLTKTATDVAITTAAKSICNKPPSKHVVRVHLERKVKGRWTNRLDMLGGGGTRVCPEIPGPTWRECTQTLDGCISGIWRVRVEVEWAGADAQGRPKSGTFELPEQPTRDIQCPGPRG